MRIKVILEPKSPLELPVHYTGLLQGFIYHQLDATLAAWLHHEAYRTDSRSYKMFTFSRLYAEGDSRYKVRDGRIRFSGAVSFLLGSARRDVLRSLAERLLGTDRVRLGHHELGVRGVEILKPPVVGAEVVRARALAPITTYSTLHHRDGRQKTYYYSPFEAEWSEQVRCNLVRKASALGWEDNADDVLSAAVFKPLKVRPQDRKIITYKGTVIQGWLGLYELRNVPEAYVELACDAGLGSKNSQGFGMIEVVP